MIDGTGMCGGCRVTVGGEIKFACVDGPDFDGHLVDFDEAMRRQAMYKKKNPWLWKNTIANWGWRKMPNMSPKKVPMPEQDPNVRIKNFWRLL